MQTQNHMPDLAALDSEGKLVLPTQVIENNHLETGDLFVVMELSPDTIVLKRFQPTRSAIEMLEELGGALRAAGYDTVDKLDEFVDRIKREATEEWLAKMQPRSGASS